jgi:hypothetical protein
VTFAAAPLDKIPDANYVPAEYVKGKQYSEEQVEKVRQRAGENFIVMP